MILSPTNIFPTTTYSIEDRCVLKIGEQEYETLLTYTIYIGKGESAGYDVAIERSNFKTSHQKIDTKFLGIANHYMEALFPLRCRIKEYRLFISNIHEIQQRIRETDKKMLNTYNGDGLEHIRSKFLEATHTEEKLREFIKQLHLMKILNIGMQKFEESETYQIAWNILPTGRAINYNKNLNSLIYEPKIWNAQELIDSIIRYIHKHDYYVEIEDKNVPLYADFYHKAEYTGETGRMKQSETNICIDVENVFLYEQKITLKNI